MRDQPPPPQPREGRAVEDAAHSVQSSARALPTASARLLPTLVVVLVTLGLTCAGVVGFFFHRLGQVMRPIAEQPTGERATRERGAQLGAWALERAVLDYHLTHEKCPPTLKVLTEPIGGKPAALGPAELIDPWGREYVYELNNRNQQTGVPRIYSLGEDPSDPQGRISNW
jgi:hypothetical protein